MFRPTATTRRYATLYRSVRGLARILSISILQIFGARRRCTPRKRVQRVRAFTENVSCPYIGAELIKLIKYVSRSLAIYACVRDCSNMESTSRISHRNFHLACLNSVSPRSRFIIINYEQ